MVNIVTIKEKGGIQMYKKILLAFDGSETSMRAAQAANSYMEKGMAEELTILHVFMSREGFYDLGNDISISDVSEQLIAVSEKNGEVLLEKAKALISTPEKVKTLLKSGDIAQTIVEIAQDFDLIIIGSRGMNTFAGLLMGSVSSRVVHYANQPILIVK